MIGTGAAPSTIINIIAIFAPVIAPDATIEEIPKLRYVQHLQTILYVLGKAMKTFIISMNDHDGEIKRSVLGSRGIVLEKGESVVAMCDGI
eukprot:1211586-Ditylum_brightwellii.AAC.1